MFQATTENDDSENYLHEMLKTSAERIKCKLCGKTYKLLPSFISHVKNKHNHKYKAQDSLKEQKSHEKEFSCNHCNKKCWDYFGLKQHVKCVHPGEKPPPASEFNSIFGTPAADTTIATSSATVNLTTVPTFRHELFEVPPFSSRKSNKKGEFIHEYIDGKGLKCKICDDTFETNKEFNKHAKAQHDMKYLCFNCSEVFQDKKLRGRHINKHHTKYCNFCNKIFNVEASLEKHVQEVHLNSQNDDIPSVEYSEAPRLSYSEDILKIDDPDDDDNNVSHDEDAYFLHETFQDKSGATIMKCKECEKTFRSYTRLRYHAREKHQYEWLCLVCCQVFPSGKYRGIHMRQNHTKDFACTLCPKKCYDVTGLREHFRAKHPDEKFPRIQSQTVAVQEGPCQPLDSPRQFKCKYCSQTFSQREFKMKHVKQDHIYACQVCRKKFHTEKDLANHCEAKNHQMDNNSQEEKILYHPFFAWKEPISVQEEKISGSIVSSEYVKEFVKNDEADDSEDILPKCAMT